MIFIDMEIKEIENKKEWEDFLEQCQEKTFLHSWHWGEFNKALGHKIWRFGVFNESQLVSVALVIKIKARRGTFLFVPHGPAVTSNSSFGIQIPNLKLQIVKILLEELKKLARKERASFIRIQPVWPRTEQNTQIFRDLNFRPGPLYLHPELTLELDLSKSQEELLKDMRKTTRNLIKRGLKTPELKVIEMSTKEGLEIFWELYEATAKRHNFVAFSKNYLEKEFEAFSKDNLVSILITYYQQKPISGAYIISWQGGAYYHHGASLPIQHNLPTSYLLQWQAILKAKYQGLKSYNFWGIAEDDAKLKNTHRYFGLTLFKKGFGGRKLEYVKTQDFVISPIYFVNWAIEMFRRANRRLY